MQALRVEDRTVEAGGAFWPPLRAKPDSSLFLAELGVALRRLRAARIRISLARLSLRTTISASGQAARVAAAVRDPCTLAGVLPNGRGEDVLAAFFGPRSPGRLGDEAAAKRVVNSLEAAMAEAGLPRNGASARVAVLHRWTDEISDLSSAVTELDLAPEEALRPSFLS